MLPTASAGLLSFLISVLLYFTALDTPLKISPQGCRMSWMSPSYILQPGFNSSWTPLAKRYSLWLYREVGWDSEHELEGLPVLFIPGNAGSSHQVRSIASSAARQYYDLPSNVAQHFAARGAKPLDFFAVEFNEDLSAFHGPTLELQKTYTTRAIDYILSRYSPNASIIVMGHSMGGVVATSLLPSSHISAIITMSTPHTVPPARFDSRIDKIYASAQQQAAVVSTPILSICGGITDTMIPSEFCTLPSHDPATSIFRKTVFSSALEGCWSGVGHREMVWCHQVRWRVARAALELGLKESATDRAGVLDEWFRDALTPPPALQPMELNLRIREHEIMQLDKRLVLREPIGTQTHLMPIPRGRARFVLYTSQGSILRVAPAQTGSLEISIYICRRNPGSTLYADTLCRTLAPDTLQLIPNPGIGQPFPVPNEGVDESEGVVAFTALLAESREISWVAVKVEGGDSTGWVSAGFEGAETSQNDATAVAPFLGHVAVQQHGTKLNTKIHFPNLVSNALIVYRAIPTLTRSCQGSLLLLHTANPAEAHYHQLKDSQPILLHAHSAAPFLRASPHERASYARGLNVTVFSSGECGVAGLSVTVDWWATLGRWGPRYWNAVLAWGAGVVGVLTLTSWSAWDSGAPMPTVGQALDRYMRRTLPALVVASFVISFLPLPEYMWLGNSGEPIFAALAPLLLLLSSGLVALTWALLLTLMWPLSKVSNRRKSEDVGFGRRGLLSMLFISALVFLVIPWQVAFLGCYITHVHSTATSATAKTLEQRSAHNHGAHVLLLMTWCLPAVTPVLAVWVRTLASAGLTTPFDGDHFAFNALGFMVLTYCAAGGGGLLFDGRHSLEIVPVRYGYAVGAAVSFFAGGRSTYRIYEALNWPTMVAVVFRLGPRLWVRT